MSYCIYVSVTDTLEYREVDLEQDESDKRWYERLYREHRLANTILYKTEEAVQEAILFLKVELCLPTNTREKVWYRRLQEDNREETVKKVFATLEERHKREGMIR